MDYIFLQKYQKAWESCQSKGVMLARLKTIKKTTLSEASETEAIRIALVEALASDQERIQFMKKQNFYIV